MSIAEEIKQLKELLDEGILTQEEFDEQKNALLKNNIQSDSVENSESETIEIKMAATDANRTVQNPGIRKLQQFEKNENFKSTGLNETNKQRKQRIKYRRKGVKKKYK